MHPPFCSAVSDVRYNIFSPLYLASFKVNNTVILCQENSRRGLDEYVNRKYGINHVNTMP